MLHFDADSADCRVFTFRDGLLSMMAHDLELRVTHFALDVDEDRRAVTARFDATSLRVVQASRDGRPMPDALGARERAQIERSVGGDVLHAERFPEVVFASTSATERPGGFAVTGTLTLHGVSRPVDVDVRLDGDRAVAEARVHQPDFGVKPFTAMLGALKVKPDVVVRVTATRAAGVTPSGASP